MGWGSENDNLGLISYFTLHLIDFTVEMYVFEVTEIIRENSEKIGLPVFVNTAI